MVVTKIWSDDVNNLFKEHIIGKTIIGIKGACTGSDKITFLFSDGSGMQMYHSQSCCEIVEVDDVCGDIDDLKDSPLLGAEMVTSNQWGPRDQYDSSYTWTFYKFRTQKGYVDIRWYGCSNGYNSEAVDIKYYEPNANDTDVDERLNDLEDTFNTIG